MEPRALRHRLLLAGAVVIAAVLVWAIARSAGDGAALAEGPPVLGDGADRITVEVLNTTNVRGLARRATLVLRAAGLDVVRYASDAPARDSTLVLDRSGRRQRALRVARALGITRVDSRPDSTRYVDVTVLLGADWRPPPQPFRP